MAEDVLSEQTPMLNSRNEEAADTKTTSPDNGPAQVQTRSEARSRPKSTNIIATVSVIPLVAPVLLLWLWHLQQTRNLEKQTSSRVLILTCILSGTLGMFIVSIVQVAIAYPTAWLCFGSEATKYLEEATKSVHDVKDEERRRIRRQMSRRWQYWASIFVFAFVMAGMVEEGMKYLAITTAQRWGGVVHPFDCIAVGVAASAGFATAENVGFVYAAWKQREPDFIFALTIIERVVFGVPLHAMMAVLTALGVMARDFENEALAFWQILALPVLFHGSFNFMLLAISAYNRNVGWVHPRKGATLYLAFFLAVLHVVLLAVVLWRQSDYYGLG